MVTRILCLCLGILLSIGSMAVRAQESLCAVVKIEILQEVTMERQGFEALMRITNSLDTFSLENVSVKVIFSDADGNTVIATSDTAASNAAFFIRVDGTRDITGYQTGTNGFIEGGVIAPKKVGELRWLIIPTANAAGQTKDGKLYFVGAELKYSYGGKDEVVNVANDSIVVKPQPALTLDYFLTQEVVGDNGFTPEIEPAEPYTLGVRISNNGFGYAKSVKIESAQPTIVENKQGLSVGFKILGSYLADQPAEPTLLLNFGNIEPKGVAIGRWIMESNLAGTFISFNASFTHADELGGALTSLLQATNANFLVHDVLVELPGRDHVRDFLAYNQQNNLLVYESEITGANEASCTNCKAVNEVAATLSTSTNQLTHFPQAGLSFATVVDPYKGAKVLSKVVRLDGSTVHPQNVWLSKKRADDKIHFDYFIHVFDNNSVGSYTLYWGENFVDLPQPPVIRFMQDYVTYEGGNLGFIVQASDPNQTIPNVSVVQLPAGASFTLSAPNQGVFNWSPQLGQAGIYPITFTATDGVLSTTRSMTIRVNTAKDTDGDGMDDDWERKHFGDLSHDGSADSDGDGRSDLQEFLDKTDPNVLDTIPGTPQILSPIFDGDTLDGATTPLQPVLTVTNGKHPANAGVVAIVYEIYKDEGLTDLMATGTVEEGTGASTTVGTTSFKVTPELMLDGASFEDNHLYYWRAKSQQQTGATSSSAWVKSKFFINTANDAPSVPHISSPAIDSIVADLSPTLSVTNATDIDRDSLSYNFVLYTENDLATPVASVSNLNPGLNGQTAWHLPKVLQEDGRYLWQAKVVDGRGAETLSEWGSFLVSLVNNAPTVPQINSPTNGTLVEQLQGDTNLTLSVINATDPERAALTYYFELDTVNTFDSLGKQTSAAIATGGAGKTAWPLSGLVENVTYYWRVRAFDGQVYSEWMLGQFGVSVHNEPPSIPTVLNPANGAVVPSIHPLLEANPALDPEGKPLTYKFEVYSNEGLTSLVAQKLTTETQWVVDIDLVDKLQYFWRVHAEDEKNLASNWSDTFSFTVVLPKVNEAPAMLFVLPDSDITDVNQSVLLQWVDSDSDSSAKINLYYRAANSPTADKISIAQNLEEDLDGNGDQYVWSTINIPAGNYEIFADISDEITTKTIKSCCIVQVLPHSSSSSSVSSISQSSVNSSSAVSSSSSLPTSSSASSQLSSSSSLSVSSRSSSSNSSLPVSSSSASTLSSSSSVKSSISSSKASSSSVKSSISSSTVSNSSVKSSVSSSKVSSSSVKSSIGSSKASSSSSKANSSASVKSSSSSSKAASSSVKSSISSSKANSSASVMSSSSTSKASSSVVKSSGISSMVSSSAVKSISSSSKANSSASVKSSSSSSM